MKTVIIYSTPTCHYCHMAKDFFDANSVAYTDYNVAEDTSKREEMIEMTGQMGVPVIKIGEETMIGFNEAKIKELLTDDSGDTSAEESAPQVEAQAEETES